MYVHQRWKDDSMSVAVLTVTGLSGCSVQVEKLRPSLCKSTTASAMLNQNLVSTLS
jgi:hypothetical protein